MKQQLILATLAVVCILPASAQTPPAKAPTDECTALWKEFDEDDDDILSDTEAARLKTILAAVDTNKDGKVSKEEFMAACQKGVLKDVRK